MDKKELKNMFKERMQIGGVFAIQNTLKRKLYIDSAKDIAAAKNRFEHFGAGTYAKLTGDCAAQNGEGFSFEVLEELHKGELQSDKEFQDDLLLLKSMWTEKLSAQDIY